MYPLELYTKTKSNTRRASWREGLLRFAMLVDEMWGSFLGNISEIKEADLLTSYADPPIFGLGTLLWHNIAHWDHPTAY